MGFDEDQEFVNENPVIEVIKFICGIAGWIIAGAWWLFGFFTFLAHYDGLEKFFGLFFIPNLALPFLKGNPPDGGLLSPAYHFPIPTIVWWGWIVLGAVLLKLSGFRVDDD